MTNILNSMVGIKETEIIKSINIGESLVIDGLTIKRIKKHTYVAFVSRDGHHRWGNLQQITEDAEYYAQNGVLPRESVSWY